jgi:hypothetical protein
VQLHESELASAVDGNEQVQLALLGADLGDVDVDEADRVGLEPLAGRCGFEIGQPGDAVTLQAAVQAGAGQAWDRGLQGIQAIVQGKQRVPPDGDDDGFLLDGEHG